MARSDYIYTVMDRWAAEPVMAFTVKREMVRWLRGQEIPERLDVYRMHDGTHYKQTITPLDVDELIRDPLS